MSLASSRVRPSTRVPTITVVVASSPTHASPRLSRDSHRDSHRRPDGPSPTKPVPYVDRLNVRCSTTRARGDDAPALARGARCHDVRPSHTDPFDGVSSRARSHLPIGLARHLNRVMNDQRFRGRGARVTRERVTRRDATCCKARVDKFMESKGAHRRFLAIERGASIIPRDRKGRIDNSSRSKGAHR